MKRVHAGWVTARRRWIVRRGAPRAGTAGAPRALGRVVLAGVLYTAGAFALMSGAGASWPASAAAEPEAGGLGFKPPAATDFYANPVHPQRSGMGDPYVFRAGDGRYYLYTTSAFQAWSSEDLLTWRSEGRVKLEYGWAKSDIWAPEVVEYNGRYYMYYSGRGILPSGEAGRRLAVAVSDSPSGPFVDVLDGPLFDFGYAVADPHVFIDDDGRKYLFYSRDASENVVGGRRESHIYGVELGDDMVSLKGEPVLLVKPEQPWELRSGSVVWNEGPFVIKRDGVYYLMYSANYYNSRDYGVGYATATHPLGPYAKYEGNPILSASIPAMQGWPRLVSGPGHHSVTRSPDGTEWIIAYHSHADVVQGSGGRQFNIDRLGFREDGTMYVNGPTVTPQPAPSGASRLLNIAGEAAVAASSTQTGRRAAALVDGEIGIDPRQEYREWASAGSLEGEWVELAWAHPRGVQCVLLYPSASPARRVAGGSLVFSDGTAVDVSFPPEPGAAAIVPAPAAPIEWLRFYFGVPPSGKAAGAVGLAEIVALGHPAGAARGPQSAAPGRTAGTVWLTVSNGCGAAGVQEVGVAAPGLEVVSVVVTVDGDPVYQGDGLPDGAVLSSVGLSQGEHVVGLRAVDASGYVYDDAVRLSVVHVVLKEPATEGAVVRGRLVVATEAALEEAVFDAAAIALAPIADGGAGEPVVLYQGSHFPPALEVDTPSYPDGAYAVVLEWTTRDGARSRLERAVVFDNWEELDDAILPPVSLGWFGSQERLKAVAKSAGWQYATDAPERYGGDDSRIVRRDRTREFITWRLDSLYDFVFTVYVSDVAALEAIEVSVSADGNTWRGVPVAVRTLSEGDGWVRVELVGVPGSEDPAGNYVRFALADDGPWTADAVQLGHVRLRSRKAAA